MTQFEFCVLGSGSSGNSVAFWDSETLFLVDAGFSCRETGRRLGLAGLDMADLDAVLFSHEHVDHVGGSRVIQRKYAPRMLSTLPVHEWMDLKYGAVTEPVLEPGKGFGLGRFVITPFEVSHDASLTVGFVVERGGRRVAMATDLGHVTARVASRFKSADAIIIESNHDVQMLKDGPYPEFLKKRILGKQGHLSNAQSAEALAGAMGNATRHVLLAHLSRENNKPEIALDESRKAIGKKPEVEAASQFEISNIIKIG